MSYGLSAVHSYSGKNNRLSSYSLSKFMNISTFSPLNGLLNAQRTAQQPPAAPPSLNKKMAEDPWGPGLLDLMPSSMIRHGDQLTILRKGAPPGIQDPNKDPPAACSPNDSATEILLPLSAYSSLRDRFVNHVGEVRMGLILELLDELAGRTAYSFAWGFSAKRPLSVSFS